MDSAPRVAKNAAFPDKECGPMHTTSSEATGRETCIRSGAPFTACPVSTALDHLADAPVGPSSVTTLVEKITDEGQIDMKEAAKLYGPRGHKSTPTRHATKGVR